MDPGLSFKSSNFEVCPGLFPVALGFAAGFAIISLARMACIFLLLLAPSFFFRFFWFGIAVPCINCADQFPFSGEVFFQFLYFDDSHSANSLNSRTDKLVHYLQKERALYVLPLVGEDSYISHREEEQQVGGRMVGSRPPAA
jgi:hypothetical protein